jgi:hypothetical protein
LGRDHLAASRRRGRASDAAGFARGAAIAAEHAAPLYLRDKVALTTDERQKAKR